MRLSVIIPTRNRADALIRLLDSLAAQREAAATEWIIVDDGSDPPARERVVRHVSDLSARGHSARLICHDSPRGVSAARNAGVRAGIYHQRLARREPAGAVPAHGEAGSFLYVVRRAIQMKGLPATLLYLPSVLLAEFARRAGMLYGRLTPTR